MLVIKLLSFCSIYSPSLLCFVTQGLGLASCVSLFQMEPCYVYRLSTRKDRRQSKWGPLAAPSYFLVSVSITPATLLHSDTGGRFPFSFFPVLLDQPQHISWKTTCMVPLLISLRPIAMQVWIWPLRTPTQLCSDPDVQFPAFWRPSSSFLHSHNSSLYSFPCPMTSKLLPDTISVLLKNSNFTFSFLQHLFIQLSTMLVNFLG